MNRVAVVTDSIACVPKELVTKWGILVVPTLLIFEDKAYRDGIDITTSEFYNLLERSKKLPTTSVPSPGELLEAYRELSQRAESIVCVTISSKLSVLFNVATQAKDLAKEALPETEIRVVDSYNVPGGQGWVAVAAARAAAAGGNIDAVVQAAVEMKARAQVFYTLDTLYYLAKGGRVPKAAAWASSILRIKPILHIVDGEVVMLERTRTKPRATQRLIDLMKERVGTEPVHINLMHANVPDEAERLKEKVLAQFNCAELYVTEFSPVMGTHTGPGVLGLAFYSGD